MHVNLNIEKLSEMNSQIPLSNDSEMLSQEGMLLI